MCEQSERPMSRAALPLGLMVSMLVLVMGGCSSDSEDGVTPLPVGVIEGTVELQGEGLLGNQRVRLTRTYETILVEVDESGHYSHEVRADEFWSVAFVDSPSYVTASDTAEVFVEEGQTQTVPPLVVYRKVYIALYDGLHRTLNIGVGAIVRWTAVDDEVHDVQFHHPSYLHVGTFGPGESIEHVFTEPVGRGEGAYTCTLHPGKGETGTIMATPSW